MLDALAMIGVGLGVTGWVAVTIHVERAFKHGDYWDAQDWVYDWLEWFYVRRAFFALGIVSGIALWLIGQPWWWIAVMPAVAALRLLELGASFLIAGRRRHHS